MHMHSTVYDVAMLEPSLIIAVLISDSDPLHYLTLYSPGVPECCLAYIIKSLSPTSFDQMLHGFRKTS